MSCGSTTCTSTTYDRSASKPVAGFERFRQSPLALAARMSCGDERWYLRRQLLTLDDRLLADIGLSREEAVEQALRSSWIRLTMWQVYL